ncbi:MAG: type II toxin-antitoxin system VapC family toxin [Lentisphaeria bacterium]|jgi:predicted nucleic-acid-binding protein|nr:type II toxin-antitoxin system VapC family toxin [Lentisphaeria bacterium]
MIGIDTNLLVRYITQDGEEAPAVTRHLEAECTVEQPGFVCLVVLCELVWVLRHAYKYDRPAIAAILERLLATAEFEIQQATLVWRALGDYRAGPADFSDYLIGQIADEHQATPVHTLDRKAARQPLFLLVGTGT